MEIHSACVWSGCAIGGLPHTEAPYLWPGLNVGQDFGMKISPSRTQRPCFPSDLAESSVFPVSCVRTVPPLLISWWWNGRQMHLQTGKCPHLWLLTTQHSTKDDLKIMKCSFNSLMAYSPNVTFRRCSWKTKLHHRKCHFTPECCQNKLAPFLWIGAIFFLTLEEKKSHFLVRVLPGNKKFFCVISWILTPASEQWDAWNVELRREMLELRHTECILWEQTFCARLSNEVQLVESIVLRVAPPVLFSWLKTAAPTAGWWHLCLSQLFVSVVAGRLWF